MEAEMNDQPEAAQVPQEAQEQRAARPGRQRRPVARFGAFAADEELEDFEVAASESETEEVARAAVAKAARRGGGRRGGGGARRGAIDAAAISQLLAAAPPLVDLLLQEDAVRSITLVCRDVLNLSLAAGGGVELEPVWEALAHRIKADAAARAAAAAAAAASDSVGGCAESDVPGAAPAPEPEPAPVPRTRRGRHGKAPEPPPPPSALGVVQEAVKADPARTGLVKKTEAQWKFKLSTKNLQGLVVEKGKWNALNLRELDVRAAAHCKWGDEACLEAARAEAQERAERARETLEARREAEKQQRQEEVELRLLENRVPLSTLTEGGNIYTYDLQEWVQFGSKYWVNIPLDDMMASAVAGYRTKERTRVLDDRLKAEGLTFFRSDWRCREFIRVGEADGIDSLLGLARRRQAQRMLKGERFRDICEGLDAAGLPYTTASPLFNEFIKTGEGDVGAEIQRLRLKVDRELELQAMLEQNGLLHRQLDRACLRYVEGTQLHDDGTRYTAQEVVALLLEALDQTHQNLQQLADRLRLERLPLLLNLSACTAYIASGSAAPGGLDAAVTAVKRSAYVKTGLMKVPSGRPWLEQEGKSRRAAHEWHPIDNRTYWNIW